jgi:calcium-dependent protein kinase
MHVRGICHRDLKMENILYENSSKQSTIRLIDFGISQTYEKTEGERKPYGGAAYTLSPEVASGGEYTSKSDVWSIGVIVWILLAGDYPFLKTEEDLKNDEKMQRLKAGNYSFGITWKGRGISDNAKLFVQGCLKKDPEKRWKAVEALEFLQDKWIATLEEKGEKELLQMEKDFEENPPRVDPRSPVRKYSETKVKDPSAVLKQTYALKVKKKHEIFDHDIIADIRRFIDYGLLKKTVLLTMANMLDRQDVGRLQEAFLMADTTHSGTITMPELKNAFKKLNIPDLDDDEMEKIFKGMDHDHSGQIHYAEFLAALAEGAGLVTKDSLSDAFDRIDIEGKGYITHDDLKAILGHSYNKGIVDKMIEEGDFKKNNRIEFDELLQLMILPDEEVNLAS